MTTQSVHKAISLSYLKTIGIVNNQPIGRGFANPVDVAFHPDGRIYVLNRGAPTFARIGVINMDEDYLFEFGKNKRRVEVERARTEQAILGYEATILDAFREVENALVAIRTLRQEYEARVRQVKSALEARRLSRARYDGGVTSYLEVLDIERSLFQSELDASRTLAEHFSAIVDLYAALGGGWDPEEEWVLPESGIVEKE